MIKQGLNKKELDIEKVLRSYKRKKSKLETTLARIEQYKYAIGNPEMIIDRHYSINNSDLGMPGAPLRNTSSPVEKLIMDKELTIEVLKEWIRDDESRIFFIKLEIEQIDIALSNLTQQEQYIIELKYFGNLFWRDIERNFNNKFREQNFISYETLKKINREVLTKLKEDLEPFYAQYNTIN